MLSGKYACCGVRKEEKHSRVCMLGRGRVVPLELAIPVVEGAGFLQ